MIRKLAEFPHGSSGRPSYWEMRLLYWSIRPISWGRRLALFFVTLILTVIVLRIIR